MKYSDFIENFADDLQVEFEERGKKIKVEVVEVDKPWGNEIGLMFDGGSNVRPVIYPKKQYEYHEEGMNYFMIVNEMVNEVEKALNDAPVQFDFDLTTRKDTITIQLINTEVSRNYLLDKPHRNVEDLSIIYRLNTSLRDGSNGSSVITNGMMELMGMNENELFELAMEKAPLNRECTIKNIHEVLNGLIPDEADEIPKAPLIVVSNDEGFHGAGSIMYPGVLEKCADVMNGDFYILPSSQHEVLLVFKEAEVDLYNLKSMVRDINDTVLKPEEFLSNNVYHYDSTEKVFEIADKYVARMQEKEKHSVLGSLKEKQHDVINNSHFRRSQDIGSRKVKGLSL